MKIFTLFFLLVCSFEISSQAWINLNSGTDDPINDIYFVNESTGWFVSHYGLIKKTSDGGQNWIIQTSSSQSELKAIQFLDINNGYIVGGSGTVLKTTNSGENWIQLSTGYSGYFYGIDFISREIGWIVGSDGKIFKTTDGGLNWTNQSPINNETFFDIDFIDENIGNVVGTGGKIYRSNLGGSDWFPQVSGTIVNGFNAVSLIDAAYGWIGGYYVKKTTNGGTNWVDLSYSFTNDVYCVNRNFGVIATNNGNVYITSDGGANFFSIPTGTLQNINCAFFKTENLGWVGGSGGLILKYVDTVANVQLTSPNGGENWFVGSIKNITWTQTNVTNIKLEYTTNNGSDWIQIVTSTPAYSGSYSWTIPNTVSSSCKIRANDVNNNSIGDESNSVFTISAAPDQSVTITSPSGGENWIAGNQYSITWTSFNVTNLKIEYTTNNGTNWNTITATVPASNGSYIWTVPYKPSLLCKVRLTSTTNSNITDQSSSNFIISSQLGSVHLHEDFDHTVLPPQGWYFDTLGDTTFGQYWERSTLSAFGSGSGSAEYYFYQANAGKLQALTTFLMMISTGTGIISFDHAYATRTNENDQLRIDYSTDEGLSWTSLRLLNGGISGELVTAPPTTVSFNPTSSQWATKSYSLPAGTNRLRFVTISAHGNNLYLDNIKISDSSTSKFVAITSPNGGENWIVGSSHDITWTQSNVQSIKLEYSTNNGTNWEQIVSSTSATTGYYSWTIPNTVSTICKIKITDVNNASVFDQSDSPFTITNYFEEVTSVTLPGLEHSALAWADYDNDGNVDFILTGQTDNGNASKIYKNIGDGTFVVQSSIVIAATASASVHWGDFNNDNYPDLLISGFNSDLTGWMTKVYKNVNGASFTEIAPGLLQSVHNGSSRWGDYDNDGDLDILVTGGGGSGEYFAKVYKNNGDETFSELSNLNLTGVNSSSSEWGDYDNDGDLDILMIGYSLEGIISRIYRNDGESGFLFQSQILMTGVWQGTAIWADFNADSFLDISLTGKTTEGSLISKIYRNNGDNTFTEQVDIPLEGVYLSSAQWGDFNNDGSNDIIISGWTTSEIDIAKFYRNNGNNTFTNIEVPLQPVRVGSIVTADYNNDGALDVIVSGLSASGRFTKLYRNHQTGSNLPPSQPSNLNSIVGAEIVNFSWDRSTDDHTPQDALSYNLVIGTQPGGYDILSPASDRTTGFRRIPSRGAIQKNNWFIKGLSPGTYYWSVQAIDGSFQGSSFSPEKSFTIPQSGNYSLYFDGLDDFVGNMLEDKITAASGITVECWAKLSFWDFYPLINKGSSGDWSYNLYKNPTIDDKLYFGTISGGYVYGNALDTNNWHHVAGCWGTDGMMRLFVDGQLLMESPRGLGTFGANNQLQFGKYFADGAASNLKGKLTRIRISKGARYSSNFTPPISYSLDANTVGQWDFTEGSGTVLSDASTNQINGTIYGGATWSTDFPQIPSSLSLTSPNGGENWTVGSSHNITWTQTGVTNVKLEYTANNGTNWYQITASTSASTGSYSWTIPNAVSTQCRVKITDVSSSSISDQSNAFFSITQNSSITIISPNGGEIWTVGSTHNITWTSSNVSNVRLEFSTNNGNIWNSITTSTSATTGSFAWTIPNAVSSNCKIRVTNTENNVITDQSNTVFTISAAPTQNIRVTSPNGGENWAVGSSHNITWTHTNVNNVKLEFTTDNGSTWSQIVSSTSATSGNYAWTIPNAVSTQCRVRITDVFNSSLSDMSNSFFSISAEPAYSITVTSPNGGENWFVGNQYSITWNSVNVENLKLEYSVNDGNEWTQIVDSIPANLGSYIWTIPNLSSSVCKARISSLENGSIYDISDSNFTISVAPAVALTSPNGGENWLAGKQYSITWTSINVQNLNIEYSTDNGIMWNTIEGSTSAGPGSYIWTIPNSVSVECLVRLSSTDNSSVTDQSDQPFTIDLERNLTLVSPSGGEVFTSGEKMAITWSSLNLETIDLYYSVDNGGYWGLIADSVDASLSTFNWDIPENNSNQVKIRLVYTRKTELRSEIVNTFTILPSPKVTLQSNLSGAFLKSGTNQLIEWFVENVSAVNLFYSSDGGMVWNEVALNVHSTTRSHNWVVPQLNSKNCRIKVVSSVDPDLSNSSAGYFTIYTYSESISLVNTWQFGDIKDINNYRLVSMPGNTTENLANVISGKHIEEWNAYWDNGNDVNYQVQYDGSEIFKFQSGKGFWVLSKNPINLNKQLTAVTIDSTLIFNVSVHRGWNIIGNPFAKSLNWSEIRAINSLPQNRLIYYWDGKWNFPTQMEPFKGYYFFNEDNRSNLKLVYPVEASLAKTGIENQFRNFSAGISISFGENEIFAVFNEAATKGLDTNDYLLPGITFSNKNLSFLRDTEDGKKRQLFIESQPMDSLGNSFRIRATNTSGEAGHLQIKPRVDLGTNNIYLLDEKYQEFIDVRSKDKFTISPQEESRYYTLLIGSDGFIKSVMTKYLPTEYILYQNYPNPFNPETSIKYALPEDSQVKIKLYDILGNEVITLFEGEEPAGVHTRTFDLSSFASGVYLYRMETRYKSFVKKMVLLK